MSWNNLTEREKNLDRKITASVDYKLCEIGTHAYSDVFNLEDKTIDRFMEITGATPKERDFIISRIRARINAHEAILRVDHPNKELTKSFKKTTEEIIKKVDSLDLPPQERIATINRIKASGTIIIELSKTHNITDACELMLENFKKSDEEFERKGRELGFNFWDKT